jgi:Tol biopolymer transport system component
MYFTADTGQGAHLWQQRFADGPVQQLTSGSTTQEEGLAVAPDGRSVISAVGQQRRGIWIHDSAGERQISLEGYAYWPLLSPDGSKLLFRVSHGVGGGNTPTELWITDLASRRFERLFPGQMVSQYDLSRDDRLVAAVVQADGKSRLWVAWLDGRQPPRPLGIESGSARFGPNGMIVYMVTTGTATSLYRTDVDGSAPQKLPVENAGNILGTVSPDGLWVTMGNGREMVAVSIVGQPTVTVLRNAVARMRWTPDGKRALIAIQTSAGPSAFGFGRTYVLPVERSALPRIPPGGFKSQDELAAVPGVQSIPYGDLMFGSEPGVYTFSKITVTSNLYRIPLP